METIKLEIPETLVEGLQIREDKKTIVKELIGLGLIQIRIEQALALFEGGKISLWRAARFAGIPLREMISHASARGLKPQFDEKMVLEEMQ